MRRAPSRRRRALALVAACTLAVPVPALAQDVDDVREEVDELEDAVSTAAAAYEEVWGAVNAAEAELAAMATRTEELEQRHREVSARVALRARAVYKRGTDSVLAAIVSADGPAAAVERATLMNTLSARSTGRIEEAQALSTQLTQARALLADRAGALAEQQRELATLQDQLEEELSGARTVLADLEQREARQRMIDRGPQRGRYACIFDRPYNFRNTWGAPRSGGRRHKGTDVFSYWNAPVYAFTDGVIQRVSNSRLGGIGLYLRGDDGHVYYYAHINGLAQSAWVGKRVEAGEHVAYNGDTGNARGGPPHVHYQVHPGGGGPVNPYEWLVAACY